MSKQKKHQTRTKKIKKAAERMCFCPHLVTLTTANFRGRRQNWMKLRFKLHIDFSWDAQVHDLASCAYSPGSAARDAFDLSNIPAPKRVFIIDVSSRWDMLLLTLEI